MLDLPIIGVILLKIHFLYLSMVERIWHTSEGGVRESSIGDRLVSGSKNFQNDAEAPVTIDSFLDRLPEKIREYTRSCLSEHQFVIDSLVASGYEPEELCFRDYLSGPHNEIAGDNIPLLAEAFEDDRYELVPTIIFANKQLENPDDNVAETSSLFIEFHKRGMAF